MLFMLVTNEWILCIAWLSVVEVENPFKLIICISLIKKHVFFVDGTNDRATNLL